MQQFPSSTNPQSALLPLRLPSAGPNIGELLQAVAGDPDFPIPVRIECLHILLNRTLQERPELVTPIFLARMCHQAATLGKGGSAQRGEPLPQVTNLCRALSESMVPRIDQFNAQGVANTAWAFATLNISNTRLFDALSHRAQQIISQFKPQEVANTAWAFATLNISDSKLFDALSHRAQQLITQFKPQDVANTAWACATLNISDTKLFDALSHRAQEIISEFNPQSVANTAWAFATLKVSNTKLFDALSHRAQEIISQFKPQHVANTAWAFATLNISDNRLFDALSHRAQEIISEFNPQCVANTAWAFASLNLSNTKLFEALCHRAQQLITEYNPQSVANTAWACATLNISDTSLFDALSHRAQEIISEFNPQCVANTAWAFATLNISNTRLFDALSHRAQQIITEFIPQNVSNTAWACAVNNPELVSKIASTKDLRMMHYSDLDWLQIYQALVGAGLERGPISAYPRYNTIISRHVPSAPSRFEHAVGTTLRSVLSTTHFTLEFGKIFAGVVTDWTVEFDGRKIVVECDGTSYHTTKGPDAGRRLGKDVLQDRIFANLGYEVTHIDSTEWEHAQDKNAFLREKLGI